MQAQSLLETGPLQDSVEFDGLGSADFSPVGVLLLSVGSPGTPDDVEEYLYNVFRDPEILTLPPALAWLLKTPLAWYISKTEAPKLREAMLKTGGSSPQALNTINEQADAVEAALQQRGIDAKLFLAMRYWHPFADEAVESMKALNITKLVILPLYPQFSICTSGSALRVLERMLYTDPGFPMKSTVVPSWYNRPGYIKASARAIAHTISQIPEAEAAGAHLLFSAQGLPKKYMEKMGDPYQEQVERSVALISEELAEQFGCTQPHSLAYQGQFGPSRVPWTEPFTEAEIARLGGAGVRALVLVPVSFVFEHMGTLNELDEECAAVAKAAGITTFARVPTLGTDPAFVDSLATVVMEALPDLNRPSMQQINEGNPVALNIVNEYVTLYTKDQLQLVPQEQPWGFTEQAEVINGRLAMLAITLSVTLTFDPTLKFLVQWYERTFGLPLTP